MRARIALVFLAVVGPTWATDLVATDGDTLRLNGAIFRLDGIDAPEIDQTCLDDNAIIWPCGVEARNRLNAHINRRSVQCEDRGPDPNYPKRRLGICTIEGESETLNDWLVREGWAIKFEPYAKGRFANEETEARENRRGIWRGCFAEPLDLRRWNPNLARLLGVGCRQGYENRTREKLFRVDTAMPPGCPIKAKLALRAQVVGYEGIYHTPSCRSYRGLKRAQRWFCYEEDARAAGFRKALTC
jgi:endonuclease YncB( thermonuclease family)